MAVALALGAFLKEEDLTHLFETLEPHGTLGVLGATLTANRVLFLSRLKEWGVVRLVERQKLANSLSKAVKAGRVGAAPPTPHLAPCSWTQTDDSLVIKLAVPSGTHSAEIGVAFEVNSLDISVKGEPSSLCGRLHGLVKPADCLWELERAPNPDPAMFAEREDQRDTDTVLVTLAKAKVGHEWLGLFAGGVGMSAKREKAPPKTAPPKAAPKAASQNPGLGFVQRKLRFDRPGSAQGGGGGGSGSAAAPAVASAASVRSQPARDHWDAERARFLWREGCAELSGEAESPPAVDGHAAGSGGGPLFWWRETAEAVVLFARTRRGLAPSSLTLDARETSIDLELEGVATPWCGSLCGRASPPGCSATVVSAASARAPSSSSASLLDDAPWAVLRLTITKDNGGPHARYWRAPFHDLLPLVDAETKRAALPGRGELLDTPDGGWQHAQTGRGFDVQMQFSSETIAGPADADALLRVAVTLSSVSVHVAGRPETPLLAGETHGRLVVGECSWKLTRSKFKGKKGEALWQLELSLVKDAATAGVGGYWPELFKVEYV